MASLTPKIFFFPLMAPGHTLPMVDLAKLFAAHDVEVTLLAIPSSIPLLRSMIGGQPIKLLSLLLPPGSLNLPGGHQNLSSLPSVALSPEFFEALELLRQPLDQLLRAHRPSCIISDMFLPWTAEVAAAIGIPRFVFHSMGFFPLCMIDRLRQYESAEDLPQGNNGTVLVPGLPHQIVMKKSQLHDSVRARNKFSGFMDMVAESELQSVGAVVNSFYELEPAYADHFRTFMRKKAWHVGPVSAINREAKELAARGGCSPVSQAKSSSHGKTSLLSWLNAKLPCSVLYVCFGSLSKLATAQLEQISMALEASNYPFLWVIGGHESEQQMEIVREEGEGLIVRGWAPQMLILNHPSIGGFVTHCGWNSLMESVSAGVPVVTWPLFADQFYNEKLAVDILRVGVAVGAEEWGMREEEKAVIAAEKIGEAVDRVMDGGEEAEALRQRARELGDTAKKAVAAGGSSHTDLSRLIVDLIKVQLQD